MSIYGKIFVIGYNYFDIDTVYLEQVAVLVRRPFTPDDSLFHSTQQKFTKKNKAIAVS